MPMFPEATIISTFQVLCLLKLKHEFYGERMYLTKEIWYGRKLTGDFIVEREQAELLWGVRVKWGAAENLFLRVT